MADFAKEILQVNIEEEMKQSYLDYAMSVIVGRALPDVRDGLKPVHRRVLYAMSQLGLDWNKAFKKSARVVGDTTGKFHPHGESAVYDALARMAQPFSMRAPLVDGQGNFGSVDGDPPAAMRYTEVRLARIAHEMLSDIDKETVDFIPNYDESEQEPSVFPTRFPNLLVNGATGIAVGMATNIPPHNLGEVVNACLAYIEDPSINVLKLMEHMSGPDFPTAGIINGSQGIVEAYFTGRGRIYMRARTHIEEMEGGLRHRMVVTELPYQVNKARLLEKIAELVKEKKIEGIEREGLRDESDKDGMRVVIELRRGEIPEVLLNNLYQHTQMQAVFGINMVALVDGQPRLLNLKALIEAFVRHRREVVTRRTLFDLRKARQRAHALEGLAVALANIDEIIALIKASPSPAEAKARLLERRWAPGSVSEMLARAGADTSRPEDLSPEYGLVYGEYRLSEVQAQAILDLRLHRLTALEQNKIISEYDELLAKIRDLLEILANPDRLRQVIREELEQLRDQFADERRTEIIADHEDFLPEDLISPEDVVVTLSHAGYVKWQPLDAYRAQKRGGKGKSATRMKEEDFIDYLFVANTHDDILCFSSRGKVYKIKVYELPQAGRTARGKPIVNLLPLDADERISAVLPVRDFDREDYVLLATAGGLIKKSSLADFKRPRSTGIIAIELVEGDHLVGAAITDGKRDIMLASSGGKVIRFNEGEVRPMGRVARGVRGMRLPGAERVISLIIVGEGLVLTATAHGYGKCTPIEDYPRHGRGGQGVISIRTSHRNGRVVAAQLVNQSDEIMLITSGGNLVRTHVSGISVLGRNTQGVRLIRLDEDEHLVGFERIIEEEEPDEQ
ncbi:MAG: DNA gyrase subunit A [Gammaproteobacteria bacterium]|nr:DNA gyrase subunit A [Gammaproteobacteria bacterium]NIR82479.1 DNA gyrase subunit A [Gammaproteobacteria bacterium]NIR88475.1 DNA gyrase subunit A [Gammaproteobacteria bacterium]NIU03615.1 DNA gyrase subunit A [Gammaproteobacteria bacterium]NIV50967.1 DNA gyrase subunit A [Gammaproteobacteria bacterium]